MLLTGDPIAYGERQRYLREYVCLVVVAVLVAECCTVMAMTRSMGIHD